MMTQANRQGLRPLALLRACLETRPPTTLRMSAPARQQVFRILHNIIADSALTGKTVSAHVSLPAFCGVLFYIPVSFNLSNLVWVLNLLLNLIFTNVQPQLVHYNLAEADIFYLFSIMIRLGYSRRTYSNTFKCHEWRFQQFLIDLMEGGCNIFDLM